MLNSTGPRVSVIIHFLDAEEFFDEAIASVLRQTFTEWELLLVDGGSVDRSPQRVKVWQDKFPHKIRSLRHPGPDTLGIFSSRIWGAQEARGAVLAHLDADDVWHSHFLERQYEIYQQHFQIRPGMVYCPMVYSWQMPALAHLNWLADGISLNRPP